MYKSNPTSLGKITSGLSPDTQILKTIEFVFSQLPEWRDDPTRSLETVENKLNSQLGKFLSVRARNLFPSIQFEHETYQTGKHSIDMSASLIETVFIGAKSYSIYEPFLVFECKRLTTDFPKERKREYVTGEYPQKISGGIQRFKLGLHGKDHAIAAMIGYIQKETAQYWHEAINTWITTLSDSNIHCECKWNTDEKLQNIEIEHNARVACCKSKHYRKGEVTSEEIEIHHLWVLMNCLDTKKN